MQTAAHWLLVFASIFIRNLLPERLGCTSWLHLDPCKASCLQIDFNGSDLMGVFACGGLLFTQIWLLQREISPLNQFQCVSFSFLSCEMQFSHASSLTGCRHVNLYFSQKWNFVILNLRSCFRSDLLKHHCLHFSLRCLHIHCQKLSILFLESFPLAVYRFFGEFSFVILLCVLIGSAIPMHLLASLFISLALVCLLLPLALRLCDRNVPSKLPFQLRFISWHLKLCIVSLYSPSVSVF